MISPYTPTLDANVEHQLILKISINTERIPINAKLSFGMEHDHSIRILFDRLDTETLSEMLLETLLTWYGYAIRDTNVDAIRDTIGDTIGDTIDTGRNGPIQGYQLMRGPEIGDRTLWHGLDMEISISTWIVYEQRYRILFDCTRLVGYRL